MPLFENRAALGRAAKKIRTLLNRDTGAARVWRRIVGRNGAFGKRPARVRSAAQSPVFSGEATPVFFIVGHQKSGTTWLMKMLDAHPEILCQGEGRPFGRNWRQEHLKAKPASYPPTSLYNAMLSSEDLRYWIERSVWTRRDDADEHLANLTRLAIEYFLTQQLAQTGKRLVGDKTVLHEPGIIEEIGEVFPDSRVIHIIRDGRDVAVSQVHHKWNQAEDQGGTGKITSAQLAKREAYRKDSQGLLRTDEGIFPDASLRKGAAKWSNRVGKAATNGPILLGDNYSEVRYEDLLKRPEEEVGRLLKFLGVDADKPTVKRCVDAASFEKLAGGRQRGEEASSFFRKGIAGDWRNVFTEQNKQDFKAAAGDLLVDLGYEKDKNW